MQNDRIKNKMLVKKPWRLKARCILAIIRGDGVIYGYRFRLPDGATAFFDDAGGHLYLPLKQKGIIACNVFDGSE